MCICTLTYMHICTCWLAGCSGQGANQPPSFPLQACEQPLVGSRQLAYGDRGVCREANTTVSGVADIPSAGLLRGCYHEHCAAPRSIMRHSNIASQLEATVHGSWVQQCCEAALLENALARASGRPWLTLCKRYFQPARNFEWHEQN